ncbi:MAG: hypothetical protein ACYTHM_21575 [Planctomycetota bacterium]|jgi:hypothetical protein
MKRFILGAVAVSILGPSSLLAADVTTKSKRTSTNKIEISGYLGLCAVYREDFFDSLFTRRDLEHSATWGRDRDEVFGMPKLSLTLEAKLKDELGAVLNIGLVPGVYGYEAPLLGQKNSTLYLKEMYVYAKEFLGKYTNLYVGEKNVCIDLRENGDEFYCNILESENPFTGAVHTDPAFTGVSSSVTGVYAPAENPPSVAGPPPLSSPSGMHWNPYLGGNAWWNHYANQSKHSTFAGAQVEWILSRDKTGREPFRVDFAIGMIYESHLARTDTIFFLARPLITFDLTKTHKHLSRVQVILSMIAADEDTAMGALGLGFSIKPLPLLEVFAEYIGEFGEYTAAWRAVGHDLAHQRAHAAYGGARVEPEIKLGKALSLTPFFECSFWWLSGDRGDPYQSNEDYVSFEDVDTFLIMEDNEFGLDVDCNYNAIKVELGARLETITLSIRIGSFRANYAPHQDLYGKPPYGASFKRLMGNEVDILFEWRFKECVRVKLGAAFLFDGFFWDETVRSRGTGTSFGAGTGTDAALAMAELGMEF